MDLLRDPGALVRTRAKERQRVKLGARGQLLKVTATPAKMIGMLSGGGGRGASLRVQPRSPAGGGPGQHLGGVEHPGGQEAALAREDALDPAVGTGAGDQDPESRMTNKT